MIYDVQGGTQIYPGRFEGCPFPSEVPIDGSRACFYFHSDGSCEYWGWR